MRPSLRIVTTLVAGAFIAGGTARAQTVDDLIARNLKAKGGIETIKATRTVVMTGRIAAQGREMSMTVSVKRPNLFRRELTMPGQTMINAFDGTTVWMMAGGAPVQALSGPQADNIRQAAEFEPIFVDYKQKGLTIELIPGGTASAPPVHHLKVTRKGAPVQHFYLDAETGLETKITTEVDMNGTPTVVETQLSDYRAVDGRMVPFSMRQVVNGQQAASTTFEKVEFNVPLEDTLFKMPPK